MAAMKAGSRPRRVVRTAGIVLLVASILAVGVPATPLVSLGPQQRVHSINPKLGIHTRLTDEVEP
jgi:hypothetical protein